MRVIDRWREWAGALRIDVHAVGLATRDARVPWYAKALALAVAAYALSPVDLVPDFIPVLGYLDDLVVLPLGIALVIRLVPADVWEQLRERARQTRGENGPGWIAGWIAAACLVLAWVGLGVWLWRAA